MPRPKFYPERQPHVTVAALERRHEKISMRDQRPTPDKPKPPDPSKPVPSDDTDYNIGG